MEVSVIGQVAGALTLALFLAMSVEKFIQIVVKPLTAPLFESVGLDAEKTALVIQWISFLLGTLVAFGFGLDLFGPMAAAVELAPAAWLTRLCTALVVGGGSNLIHDLWPQNVVLEIEQDEIEGTTSYNIVNRG